MVEMLDQIVQIEILSLKFQFLFSLHSALFIFLLHFFLKFFRVESFVGIWPPIVIFTLYNIVCVVVDYPLTHGLLPTLLRIDYCGGF